MHRIYLQMYGSGQPYTKCMLPFYPSCFCTCYIPPPSHTHTHTHTHTQVADAQLAMQQHSHDMHATLEERGRKLAESEAAVQRSDEEAAGLHAELIMARSRCVCVCVCI
jgi:hypothetical protein